MQNNLIEENKLLNNKDSKDGENKKIKWDCYSEVFKSFNSIQWEENKIQNLNPHKQL